MGFWPRTAAAVRPAAALKTPVRIPQGEDEEEMRLPSASGAGGGGHCCRCAVLGALFFLRAMISRLDITTTRTRHATHPPAVPMVEGDAEGGGGGDLANGPLDGRTNRGSNPRRRRAPPMAHTTRPSMPLMLFGAKVVQT